MGSWVIGRTGLGPWVTGRSASAEGCSSSGCYGFVEIARGF